MRGGGAVSGADLRSRLLRFVQPRVDLQRRKRLRRAEDHYALAARGANDGLWDWNIVTGECFFSPRWKEMLGFEEEEISNSIEEWFDRVHPEDLLKLQNDIRLHLEGETPHLEAEYRMRQQDGTYRWMFCRGVRSDNGAGGTPRIAGSQSDVTERKLAVEELLKNAFHDSLTGLPNRMLFMDRLQTAALRTQRGHDHQFAVLFIDLDRFKPINDTFGHLVGDQLLIEVARRLEGCTRPGDTVARNVDTLARLGGDEFTLLLDEIHDATDAIRAAERILAELKQPFFINGHELHTSASIGVAVSSTGFEKPEDMLRDADTAMYRAKKLGKARHEVCDQAMHDRAVALLEFEGDLRRAEERDELELLYQPIVALERRNVVGFEALLRWHRRSKGTVLPAEFIPIAEEGGLIRSIGAWVLRQACLQLAEWQRDHKESITVSVNVSGKQLSHIEFMNELTTIVGDSGVDPVGLRLEVTESSLVKNLTTASETLKKIKDLGIQISIDDFGTGYSSFMYLHRFPIDTLKIDQSFVGAIAKENDSSRIVEVMVPLAGILGMSAVAEGIETEEQLAFLRQLNCTYGQGYLFSPPVPANEAARMIASSH